MDEEDEESMQEEAEWLEQMAQREHELRNEQEEKKRKEKEEEKKKGEEAKEKEKERKGETSGEKRTEDRNKDTGDTARKQEVNVKNTQTRETAGTDTRTAEREAEGSKNGGGNKNGTDNGEREEEKERDRQGKKRRSELYHHKEGGRNQRRRQGREERRGREIKKAATTEKTAGGNKEVNETSSFIFEGYPEIQMSNKDKNDLTRRIGNEALKRGMDIKVKRHGLKKGGVIITHEGKTLKDMMDDLIGREKLTINGKAILRGEEGILNRQHEVTIRINNPQIPDEEILEWIEKGEKGTKATKWRVTRSGAPQENGREITAMIPGGAMRTIRKAGMRVIVGGGLHTITIREKRG